ncbi:AAA family ATPase/60S ribosome export protein-like protein Rix7 [Patellaria atrata CBS 101060]|uniref:AAA family ATPase/60S ribosome export protein-like protein Rix7 n=1 Tax=Patellaria atrata CBS 101060 TaxID=1346257 RepID=A0A9P4S9M3_9PEZI|nr:AAA family ATPase/60S ribosome export protein-like protein Rix7 [Patellaria atrata CBS 101060]
MPPKFRPRASLQGRLDKDVFTVVMRYLDDRVDRAATASVYAIYDHIQRSNSSLKRQKKDVLCASVERVLDVLRDEADSGEDEMEALEGESGDNPSTKGEVPDTNAMNRSIVGSWAHSGAVTPVQLPNGETKKRDGQRQTNGEPKAKRKKVDEAGRERDRDRDRGITVSPPTHVKLEDVGGVDNIKLQLKNHLVLPLLAPEEYVKRRIPIPRGILLHGPPGCGKTVISRAFAAKLGVPFIEILGPSVVSGMSGESERQIREHFAEARKQAPCLIFIDEIDVIAPKRDTAQSQMEKRIVAQLLISMDSLAMESNDGKPVIVLAATNRPDSLDPALRRGGRFDTEINMGVPNERMRELILRAQTRDAHIAADVDFAELAKRTPGFVGADLRDLVGKAGTWSMDQYREALEKQSADIALVQEQASERNGLGGSMEMDLDNGERQNETQGQSEVDQSITRLITRVQDKNMPRPVGFEDTAITMEAFLTVLPDIQPSSKREGFATIPDITWADIGALQSVRDELITAIVEPIMDPARFKKVGISAPTGVLLWGPPGCGKTLLAKAVAAESKANFISVKGPELLNKFVGESERALRTLFTRARSSIPCVIFFDELDALVPKRGSDMSEVSSRVVNTLLTELDGLSAREGIYVVAATNRPDVVDDAMLRPGRLETPLYVGLPGPQERVEILTTLIKNAGITCSQGTERLGKQAQYCERFSGADLSSLLRKAGQIALKRGAEELEVGDIEQARAVVKPSVANIHHFEKLKGRFGTV